MTDRELLHKLIDDMSDEQIAKCIDFISEEIATADCKECEVDAK